MTRAIQAFGASLAILATMTHAAVAQSADFWGNSQPATYATPDDTVRLDLGIGAMYIEGNEKVMSGDYTVSHLIWQSKVPVLRGSIAIDVGSGFSVRAEGSVAAFGTSYMEDYDWLKGDDTFDNWSHRSQHPDTNLDHYFTGAAAFGYELVNDETAVVRAHAGFKYTDVKWSAYGGSYSYSSAGGFRDLNGTFPDGVPGISYRQQFPELFLGFDGEERYGNVRLGGLLRGGVTFLSVATDDHWMRNLHFVDSLYVAPTFTAGADVGFALSPNVEVTLAARYDHIFEQRGDTKIYNIPSGNLLASNPDTAAGALRSAEITAGLHGSF
jgi:outer membrane protease